MSANTSATSAPPAAAPHRRSTLRRVRRGLTLLALWAAAGLVALALGGLAVWGLGETVWRSRGMESWWVTREWNTHCRLATSLPVEVRRGRLVLAGLETGLPLSTFELRASRGGQPYWTKTGTGALLHPQANSLRTRMKEVPGAPELFLRAGPAVTFFPDEREIVTRATMAFDLLQEDALIALFRKAGGTWGWPAAAAYRTERDGARRIVAVWRTDEQMAVMDAVPRESVLPGPHWLLKVQLIDSSDPRYETRLESGGLLPTDPLAHELGAMLTLESPIPDTVREQMADEFMWPDGERDVSARPGMIDAGRISITVRGRDGEERPLPVDPFQE